MRPTFNFMGVKELTNLVGIDEIDTY
jgi:hypothetical protein